MIYYSFKIFSSPTCKLSLCWMTQPCAQVFSVNGSILNLWRQWFNNLQRAALFTSFWRQWFNNLQRTAFLTSLVQYDRLLGQQQLFMVNYACGFNQLETEKYFEWIIIISNTHQVRSTKPEEFKADSDQSSSNKCKNYLLKIYSQHINFLNTIWNFLL